MQSKPSIDHTVNLHVLESGVGRFLNEHGSHSKHLTAVSSRKKTSAALPVFTSFLPEG